MTRRTAQASAVLAALLVGFGVSAWPGSLLADAKPEHPVPEPYKQPPSNKFECRWADTPITLDGLADEPAWTHAQPITAFHVPWLGAGKARLARTSTTAKLLWDREYLYFHCDMEDSDLFADIAEHDGDLWKNDVFELFLRPDSAKTGYYEFQVSAAGTTFDAFYPKYDLDAIPKQSKAGTFKFDAKVKLRGTLNKRDDTDKGWSVEGRIAWTDFGRAGGRPAAGEAWKLNLCRFDYNANWNEPELSCVANITKKTLSAFFHQSDDYATLTFVGPDAATAKPFGLDSAPRPTSSTVVGFPDPPPPFVAVRALDKFRPEFPIRVEPIPGGTDMLLVTQPRSYGPTQVWSFAQSAEVTEAGATKLMDTPHGGTAYDIAFHPKFADNGFVYIGWNGNTPARKKKYSAITRYTMTKKAPYKIDEKSATTIVEWESDGHNGCAVCFGENGLMYVTSGDGTSDSDTNLTGQRTDLMLAKVLRIDVDNLGEPGGVSSRRNYSIPKDNPYVDKKEFVPETWAYGLRNPWRMCYDAKAKQLWVGQNGQDLWEQAYLVKKGENYGWSVTEGSHPFYPERKAGPTPIVKPTVEHHHSEARSLTGGVVYRGKKFPELDGAYIYGDYSTGHVWAVKHTGEKIEWHKKIAITTLKITNFALDRDGELLICHHAAPGDGGFFTLAPNPAKHADTFPKKLSDSGLFASVKDHAMKPGVIPYSVNAPFWSDSAHKARFLAVPEGTIGYRRTNGWEFPDKTVLVKSFALDTTEGDPATRKWIETRFMTKQGGEWYGYSYKWNDAGTDATLVEANGADVKYTIATKGGAAEQVWHYPGRAECMVCHSRAANYVLGLCEVQMNKDHTYPTRRTDNQLRVLEHLGLLSVNWAGEAGAAKPEPNQREPKESPLLHVPPAALKRLADPYDAAQPLEQRAKAWLHTNCATCHVEAGGGNAQLQLDYPTAWDKMRLIDAPPVHPVTGRADWKLIASGAPDKSEVLRRIGARGPNSGQMPPLSSTRVDTRGVELMTEWCKSLKK